MVTKKKTTKRTAKKSNPKSKKPAAPTVAEHAAVKESLTAAQTRLVELEAKVAELKAWIAEASRTSTVDHATVGKVLDLPPPAAVSA